MREVKRMQVVTAEWHSTLRRRLAKELRRNMSGYLFLLPAMAFYFVLVLYPLVINFQLSLLNWDGISRVKQYVGLANYTQILNDPVAKGSLVNNIIWTAGGMIPIALGLVIAVLLWGGTRGRAFFRTVFFMPQVLSMVVIGLVWRWVYHPIFGAFNELLKVVGLGSLARGWLGDPDTAMLALITVMFWHAFGFWMVIMLAGLQNVDLDLYDAAKIDGANAWQLFIYVTVPQLRNTITLCVALAMIGGLNVFDMVFITTKGGPVNHTEVMGTYIYKNAFNLPFLGYAATLSVVLMVLVMICTILFIRLREREE